MAAPRFKLNETVIIKNNDKFQIAIIINRGIMMKRRTFDVKTETGYVIPYVPVDDFKAAVYIDSNKTSKLINKISTNLSPESSGNIS